MVQLLPSLLSFILSFHPSFVCETFPSVPSRVHYETLQTIIFLLFKTIICLLPRNRDLFASFFGILFLSSSSSFCWFDARSALPSVYPFPNERVDMQCSQEFLSFF